ncbi:MAG: hypothetical protein ACK4SY_10570 [Pyrobaculum sp.]
MSFFRELVKRGLPIVFHLLGNTAVVTRGDKVATFVVRHLKDPQTGGPSGASLVSMESGAVIDIGDSQGGVNLRNVVWALRVVELLSQYEADMWAIRISSPLESPTWLPEPLEELRGRGLDVYVVKESCDVAVGVRDVIGMWINCTGRVDMAFEEQEASGIYRWGPLKEYILWWVEKTTRQG